MLMNYLIAFVVILFMLTAWVIVQRFAHWYASRHPELGAVREEGAGCGGGCRCKGGDRCHR